MCGGGHSPVLHRGSRGRATAGKNMSSCPGMTATVGQYSCQEPLCPQKTHCHNAICTLGLRGVGLGRACKSGLFILGGSHHGGRKVIAWPHSPGTIQGTVRELYRAEMKCPSSELPGQMTCPTQSRLYFGGPEPYNACPRAETPSPRETEAFSLSGW